MSPAGGSLPFLAALDLTAGGRALLPASDVPAVRPCVTTAGTSGRPAAARPRPRPRPAAGAGRTASPGEGPL